ncbi:hypothetical protein CBLAS_0922 [Campylobacter blaseri]|uniref:DNA methyltransferase n=1 Tax=Campylobacter blaseri TaxID=2042961 RepID=A0A2P8QYN5_9BACT|nr:DNA methyltransferase [Campylobacter blaseri]PSM51357.1 DNA methyltransferase [Campylobacter blaseri]PSM52807.1 DNA methyltransferase [Campylobacter blaseri]QKF86107.1 hypothetical protein CBLAS_0922 [Campylobacter blaseri]
MKKIDEKLGFFEYYKRAPLPFQGQKRGFIKDYVEVLEEFPDDAVYLDLFGGSGLLSHVTKRVKPNARVIYNDFDNFEKRIKNIKTTNQILKEIREILGERKKYGRKIEDDKKEMIISLLKDYENKGFFVDVNTLSQNFLFSGDRAKNIEELSKKSFFDQVTQGYKEVKDDYLFGIEILRDDYLDIYEKYKNENIVLVLDPPYLQTDVASYSFKGWSIVSFLKLYSIINHPFIFFSSDKSEFEEFINYEIEGNRANDYIKFCKIKTLKKKTQINKFASYQDFLFYNANKYED